MGSPGKVVYIVSVVAKFACNHLWLSGVNYRDKVLAHPYQSNLVLVEFIPANMQ